MIQKLILSVEMLYIVHKGKNITCGKKGYIGFKREKEIVISPKNIECFREKKWRKIMKIIRNGEEFELTETELLLAYKEQKRRFEIQDVEENMESNLSKAEYEKLKDNMEFIKETAINFRSNQDKYDMDFEYAMRYAINETKVKYL